MAPESTSSKNEGEVSIRENVVRTPSPTPSELQVLRTKYLLDPRNFKNAFSLSSLKYHFIIICLIVIVTLFFVYNKQIIGKLSPATIKLRELKGGWVIPIVILVVLSFPPLMGQEIVIMLVGLVYSLWVGFLIVAAGTLIGEIGNFYAFRYLLKNLSKKWEQKKIRYACLVRIVKTGGFKGFIIACVIRYSAIPGHFTTALFSVVGMNIIVFTIAAALSLPKQFAILYIGFILKADADNPMDSFRKNTLISLILVIVTTVAAIAAMTFIRIQINKVKHEVVYERRKARQAQLEKEGGFSSSSPSALEAGLQEETKLHAPSPQYPTKLDSDVAIVTLNENRERCLNELETVEPLSRGPTTSEV